MRGKELTRLIRHTASPSNPDPDFSTVRTQPQNRRGQQGVDLGSQNYNWRLPLVGLPGRVGLDLGLTLVYNSLVWVKDGTTMRFNADRGFPGPGFQLGLPTIQQKYHNPLIDTNGVDAYLMVMPSGGAVELRQVGTSNVYESADGSYMQMVDNGASGATVRTPNGTEMTFVPLVNNEMRCTRIMDRNGNFISASYQATTGRLSSITDTLGRTITFVYNSTGNLGAIRQQRTNDAGTAQTFTWATFTYDALGQQVTASATSMTQSYDGDGLRVKKVENGITTYYVRSSLLDGQVVAELNPQGQMQRGYVYLGGQLLALQEKDTVTWVHQDPVTKSHRFTDSAGVLLSHRIDLDPWGGHGG